jgi:hypothetical protein
VVDRLIDLIDARALFRRCVPMQTCATGRRRLWRTRLASAATAHKGATRIGFAHSSRTLLAWRHESFNFAAIGIDPRVFASRSPSGFY